MTSSTPDLNDFLYLAHVVEHGGFAAAGRALGQPKSKLSKRIAAMEARLGVQLVERTSRRFVVTEIGHALARRGRAMLDSAEEAESLAAHARGTEAGTIRLGVPGDFIGRIVGQLLPAYLAAHPLVRIVVVATDEHIDIVAEKIDLVVRVRTDMRVESAMTLRKLDVARRILVASPAFLAREGPITSLSDLAKVPTLSMHPAEDKATWHFTGPDHIEVAFDHKPRLTYASSDAQRAAVNAGLGVSLLHDRACAADLAATRMVHVLPAFRARAGTVYLGFRGRRQRPAVRALIEHITTSFGSGSGLD